MEVSQKVEDLERRKRNLEQIIQATESIKEKPQNNEVYLNDGYRNRFGIVIKRKFIEDDAFDLTIQELTTELNYIENKIEEIGAIIHKYHQEFSEEPQS